MNPSSLWRSAGYLPHVGLGASHMLTGYDHLLFLFGVVFFLSSFRDVVKFVSVFTLGHCLTLIFATYFKITWNCYLIDAIIALSVMYKAFDNNGGFQKHFQMASPSLLWMVFAFGLLHGFGLSTRLQQLPLGDDPLAMLWRILSFNVGVELGQIAALVVVVGLLALWRHRPSFRRFAYMANLALFAAPAALADAGGSCHFHGSKPATEAVIADCARQRKASLVKPGKIDASWQAVKHDRLERVDGKKGKKWKVKFRNPAVTDAAKHTLCIFFSQPGNFIVANHTGQ